MLRINLCEISPAIYNNEPSTTIGFVFFDSDKQFQLLGILVFAFVIVISVFEW